MLVLKVAKNATPKAGSIKNRGNKKAQRELGF
jgi:hypothetical protein